MLYKIWCIDVTGQKRGRRLMKFLHTSDLHIGKTVHEFSMLNEQSHVLGQIVDIATVEKVDAVVIAGDIYDRSIPSTDAVNMLDDFLTTLIDRKIKVILISGNHDSPERVGFADRILEKQGLYIGSTMESELKEITFEDKYGKVNFVLLPFVKPAVVNTVSSQNAVDYILEQNGFDVNSKMAEWDKNNNITGRNVLVTHFFVVGSKGEVPELSESETSVNVGGLEQVSVESFKVFDYVALGHIHKAQKIGDGHCYYAGSPLKYSFSECNQVKSVNIVTMEEEVSVRQVPITPIHEMRRIKGKMEELIRPEVVDAAPYDDYIHVTLTDEEELIDPIGTLRSVYPNVMQITLQKNELKSNMRYETKLNVQGKSTMDLFREFYQLVREEPLDEIREQIVRDSLKKAGKEDVL